MVFIPLAVLVITQQIIVFKSYVNGNLNLFLFLERLYQCLHSTLNISEIFSRFIAFNYRRSIFLL